MFIRSRMCGKMYETLPQRFTLYLVIHYLSSLLPADTSLTATHENCPRKIKAAAAFTIAVRQRQRS